MREPLGMNGRRVKLTCFMFVIALILVALQGAEAVTIIYTIRGPLDIAYDNPWFAEVSE